MDDSHGFTNNSSEILQILDVGTGEKEDIITYPDDNVIYIKNKGLSFNLDKRNDDCLQNQTNKI